MIKRAKITLMDSGFLTSARQGTAKFGTNKNNLGEYICNGGNAITLVCGNFSLRGGTNLSDEPNPSSNAPTETHFNTFDNDVYEVPFLIDVTSSSERALLKEINVLRKTLGVKLLYSSDTSTTIKMLPEILGRINTAFNTSTINGVNLAGIPLFICRVIGIQIDNASGSRKYAVAGKLTIKEEKVD